MLFLRRAHITEHPSRGCPLLVLTCDWIGCIFVDGDEESSDVGRGVLHGDSSLLAMVMSDSSMTESNKVAETFGRPQLGHFQGHEDLSNTER